MSIDFKQVKEIFLAAVDQADPKERQAFLRQACGDDAALRRKVEALLGRHEQTNNFLEQAAFEAATFVAPSGETNEFLQESAGTSLGRYKLVQKIGEGGMGVVWMAQQEEPIRRQVAVKVIRVGLESAHGIARFEAERQALALMDHPNIAKVLDGGTTADDRPYFVMELVQGTPITRYCDEQRLSPRQRLELFVTVCRALQHAHQKGIIHRDIKPSNVLVAAYDNRPVVKVIDFGVAKAAGTQLTERTLHTEFGTVVGTLEYMSPEQAELTNQDIDTRSDVYSLGVLLYELLTGTTPLTAKRLKETGFLELLRAVREEEPPRPSMRLSDSKESLADISAQRQTEPAKLRKFLRGELDWIVMKALEKDRSRRYETANGLARDVERYLNDETVEACPPSAGYRLRKLLRRHKGSVAAVGGILLALLVGLAGTLIFAAAEAEQRREADRNARLAEEEKNATLYQSYRAHIAAAGATLQDHDVVDAARQLAEAPEGLRGWEWHHLHSRLDDSLEVIPLPAAEGGLVAGLPDRLQTWVLTSSGLRITDLESGEARTLPIGPRRGQPVTVTNTRRGLRIVACVGNTALELLDEAGQVLCRVKMSEARPVLVSPDGARLASYRLDGDWSRLMVFDATSGKQTALCEGHRGDAIWGFSFSPDGTRLASVGEDEIVRLWDPATGAPLATCSGHTSKILSVAFRPDGARLVTTSSDGTVRQWDAKTGREVEAPYDRHSGEVVVANYSPDGQWVASAGSDRTIRVWRAKGRQDVAVLHGHTGVVVGVAFAPDGGRLASSSGKSGPGWLADNTVRVWEVDLQATLPVLRGHTSYVYPVAFSPDGRWIASGSWDKTVRLWDAATGEPCATLSHPGFVPGLAYGPDGTWLVSGNYADDRLRIWDTTTARVRKEIQGATGQFRLVTVSPDGKRVAATGYDGQQSKHHLRVCEVESGAPLFSAEGGALAYSPNGRWLAVRAADDNTLLLLDARTHETVARFSGHEKFVYSAAFSPDSRRLASCSHDRTVRLWQIDSGACQVLRGHTDEVFAAAFHKGGTRLATAGRDRAVWLWDLTRGEDVARLAGHTSYVWSLAFSPDGKSLVSGSGDSTVRLWDTAPLSERYKARREAEMLRLKAEKLVEQLFTEKNTPDAVVAALRADRSLDELFRHAAIRAVLRKQAQ